MSVNPATRLVLDPLWRMLDAEDRAAQVAEAWYTRHEKDIETSKAEHGLSDTDVALDPREYLAFDDVSTYGNSWQLKEIDGIAQKLDAVGEKFLANQLRSFLVEETVGETFGAELKRWVEEALEIRPSTSRETEISPPGPAHGEMLNALQPPEGEANRETPRRVASTKRKRGRSVHHRTSVELFKSALSTHHNYGKPKERFCFEPISTRGIEKLLKGAISDSTAHRLMSSYFGGVKAYKIACLSRSIETRLTLLFGDVIKSVDPTVLEQLVADESDPE